MKPPYKYTGGIYILLGIFTVMISAGIALFAQFQLKEQQVSGFTWILFGLLCITLIMFIVEKMSNYVFNRNVLINIFIPIVGIVGSLHSILDIYYKMGNAPIKFFYINNDTNFMSLFFFAIYTLLYNGIIIDWCDNLRNSLFQRIMLIIIEVPNLISWWVLIFSSSLSYMKINSVTHFWFSFFSALSVNLLLMGIRLIKKNYK
ncbi:TPA: hypothetical protein ROY01_006003 [Bacillus toyonensis]|nr:hypothetical protein [Bacillus toyonensis]